MCAVADGDWRNKGQRAGHFIEQVVFEVDGACYGVQRDVADARKEGGQGQSLVNAEREWAAASRRLGVAAAGGGRRHDGRGVSRAEHRRNPNGWLFRFLLVVGLGGRKHLRRSSRQRPAAALLPRRAAATS